MTDNEMQRQTYNMVLQIFHEWPTLKAEVLRQGGQIAAVERQVARLTVRQDRHRDKLSSISEEIDEAEAKRRKSAEAKRERDQWLRRAVFGIGAALFVSACSAASSYAVARIVPPPASVASPSK